MWIFSKIGENAHLCSNTRDSINITTTYLYDSRNELQFFLNLYRNHGTLVLFS